MGSSTILPMLEIMMTVKNAMTIPILVVVVLYRTKPTDSPAIIGLQNLFLAMPQEISVNVLLYDNSPNASDCSALFSPPLSVTYIHNPENPGICTAYNHAWHLAGRAGCKWLMLLDQDTTIAPSYWQQLINSYEMACKADLIIPRIWSDQRMISPVKVIGGIACGYRPLGATACGALLRPVMAINSGMLIKIEFLNLLGGFNTDFPLDCLDYWFCWSVYRQKRQVYVLDADFRHELSIGNFANLVSRERYRNIIDSELRFYTRFHGALTQLIYAVKTFVRGSKLFLQLKDKYFAAITFRAAWTLFSGALLLHKRKSEVKVKF